MADGDIDNLSSSEENIIPINIEEEMRGAYIDYSMSVIISRALPDVRDGLKPVHRRILYGMDELGVNYNKSYKKCARIVGDVLGKYHPHGDTAVYDTMVRMAQDWSMRYPLVDGQGNFGSVDGDSPAAMRYTEARLRRISEELLADIRKNTVTYVPNYDDSTEEPSVLPSKIPNLLVNGASGIAVGMATNMAPHNLTEVVNGTIAYIEDNEITIEGLMEHVTAPDFPTGATIYGYQGVRAAFETGRGRVVLRAKAEFDTTSTGREQIIVTEIPYQVNKATMIEKTAALINEKKIEGIVDIRDESDKQGMRVVYDLKKDAIPNIVLNNLYKQTALQSSFSVNNVALVKGRPKTLNLKDLIVHFVDHRHEVVVRRTQYELDEAERRAHILEGYLIALDNLDEVINLIRSSKDPDEARIGLIEKFSLSEIQAKAILDMRLQRLTGLERDKIQKEYEEIQALIKELNEILGDEGRRMQIIKDELLEMKERYGDERRSDIQHSADEFTAEDMIPDEDMVITISHQGYIKRTPLIEYRTQGRGGVGSRAATSKDDDFTEHLFIASAHNYLLIFTEFGKVFWKKVWELPEGSKASKGRPIQNLINIESEDKVRSVINVKTLEDPDYINNNFLVMCTQRGVIKKTSLEAYSRPRKNGINAITIRENDKLLNVRLTDGDSHIVIASNTGKAINFHEKDVRSMGRMAAGVKGINITDKEFVVGMVCVDYKNPPNLLVVSEKGYGKRSDLEDYRITKRGGKGVKTLNVTDKTGQLVAIKDVIDGDELMIINRSGIAIRMSVDNLRVMGRATQGVRLIKLNDEDEISAVEKISNIGNDNEEDGGEENSASDQNENQKDNE
ncbi:DNA gyrase subunit A [Ekhidna lutea]|uniref:DNA gyrase subunit A n=1 Tax=Ekhidna lutea TaxID=447679 RepID=A0A239GXB3_EKHLU|nr:DNA gyrase subunit A [Ekhidna lutea]SNS73856.1 DNA gyrase subunit A [Ekhidna lutea]